jgi:hypothetical protein
MVLNPPDSTPFCNSHDEQQASVWLATSRLLSTVAVA